MASINCKQIMSDCFTVGSFVLCKTCYKSEIEGEVMAFDPSTKMLILKSTSSCGDCSLNDFNVINLSYVSDIVVKKEKGSTPEKPLQALNLQRLNTRTRNNIESKRRLVSAYTAGVSAEGRSLFMQISKTINEVAWRGTDIVVWQDDIIIGHPYGVKDIRGNEKSKEYTYIRKVVEKHIKDQETGAPPVAFNNGRGDGAKMLVNVSGRH